MAARARRNRRTPKTAISAANTVTRGMIGLYVATKRKGMTQPQLASASGVAQPRISNLETANGAWLSRADVYAVLNVVSPAKANVIADLYQALRNAKDI